jgi:hypothetical protein
MHERVVAASGQNCAGAREPLTREEDDVDVARHDVPS